MVWILGWVLIATVLSYFMLKIRKKDVGTLTNSDVFRCFTILLLTWPAVSMYIIFELVRDFDFWNNKSKLEKWF